jgi:uncharacterized repeat protein (TIGR01451 family)
MVVEPAEARHDAPLNISTAAIPNTILVGDPVNLTITETNNSHHTYHEVAVRDWLPDGVTYVSAVPTQGECFYSASVHNVFCELGNIPHRGSVTVNITATGATPGTYTNTAWDILNNRADATLTVNPRLLQ